MRSARLLLQLLLLSGKRGEGEGCHLLLLLLLFCCSADAGGQEVRPSDPSTSAAGRSSCSAWRAAGAASQCQYRYRMGPGAGALMITKEAVSLVAPFCHVALRDVSESSTSSLHLWPSQ